MWFVEHVVYGEGLYFLEFDKLQIKRDQMNGPVSGGYTCAELWFSISVNLNMHTHPKPYMDVCIHRFPLSETLIIWSVLEEAHDSSPACNQTDLSCEGRLHFMTATNDSWLCFNVMVCFKSTVILSCRLECVLRSCAGCLHVNRWSEIQFKYFGLLDFVSV